MTSRNRAVSSSVSSVSSSQSRLSLISNSDFLDFTPGIKGECLYEPSSSASGDGQSIVDQNSEQNHQCPLEKDTLERDILSPEVHKSSKPSSLRLPSQKIGFFDGVSGMPTSSNDQIQPKTRLKNTKPKQFAQPALTRRVVPSEIAPVRHGKRRQHCVEEKENMFPPDDTVIELNIKSSPSSSSSSSKLVANGSSSSEKHPSKAKRPMQPTMAGLSGARIPFSIKGSPFKKSAIL